MPSSAEHLLAEPVRRRDRRRVEVGDGAREAVAPQLHYFERALGEQRHDLILRSAGPPASARVSPCSATHEPLAHPLAELACGHPRERHQQQLVQRCALGDVARGQRGDRVRLARPGTRLEHSDPDRQRPAKVERKVDESSCSLTARSAPRCASRPVHRASCVSAEPGSPNARLRRLRRFVGARGNASSSREREHAAPSRSTCSSSSSSPRDLEARLPRLAEPPPRRPRPRGGRAYAAEVRQAAGGRTCRGHRGRAAVARCRPGIRRRADRRRRAVGAARSSPSASLHA